MTLLQNFQGAWRFQQQKQQQQSSPYAALFIFLREIVDWFSFCHMWEKTLYYPFIQEKLLIFQGSSVIQKGTVSKCQPFLLGGKNTSFWLGLGWWQIYLPKARQVPWAATEKSAQPSAKIDLNTTQTQGIKFFNRPPKKAKFFVKRSSNIRVNTDVSCGKHGELPEMAQLLFWEPLAKSDLST